ncbi:MAG: glycosyltransferase family A protein, partial [candidate division WOR-3 bacterium]
MERQDSNNLPPAPTVSALICTADRGDTIVPAVKSILRPDSICCELIIVDQSNDNRTEEAIRPFLSDARLRYIRTPTRGKGIALNIGLKEAIGEIVAITDDDCEVCGDWPACHVRLYRQNPDLVLTYGNVLAANYDPSEGIIPV